MVYELRKYNSFEDLTNEDGLGVIAWETDEIIGDDDIHFCGKLITYVFDEKTVVIPDGIEILGYSFLVPYFWGAWSCMPDTIYIPASVKTIEEGAFAYSDVNNIVIDPNSPCGIIKDNGLYTKDGKTLLWILDSNNETEDDYEYVVSDGVERIGVDFYNGDINVLVIPNSVTQIGFNADIEFIFEDLKIKAPKGSYAIDFAKEHNIEFEEID